MRNATPPSVRVKPVQWTVLPADSEPITFTSASEMDRWFASHPEVDPLTVPMWRRGLVGGGDVKLLAALALWLPPLTFVKLLVIMSLLGGALTIVVAAWHYTVTRRLDAKIPYGVAIASAGLSVLAPMLESGWRSVTGA